MRKPIWLVAGALVLISAAVLLYSWRSAKPKPPGPVVASAPEAPAVQNPMPEPPAGGAAALPPLDGSDAPLASALAELIGKPAVERLFKPELLVRHIVVTVDNLPRKRAAVELRPTRPVPGQFIAEGNDQHSTLDPANYQRYAPYVQVVQLLDIKQLAALYVHFFPLFQQAYQSLGYPNGYFNDRLVDVIDNLLATPEVNGDIVLVRPNVMYQFADPKLEQLSAGQKLLLRIGPVNAAIVKSKLRELRALIADRNRDSQRSRGATDPRSGNAPGPG